MTVRPPRPPSQPAFPALLFTRANRPFSLVILVAVAALAAYLAFGGGDGAAAPTTTGAPGTSTSDAAASTVTTGGATTLASGSETTGTTGDASATTAPATADLALRAAVVADGFSFPVYAASPAGDDRVFVVERAGVVAVVEPGGSVRGDPFLDLTDLIDSASGVELGMLGLAFHPDYAANGRFFVHYTDLDTDSVIAEYAVSADPNVADPASGKVILEVDQVGFRHRGGMLTFGPDGYLYIGLGDGTDAAVNPQSLDTLQGSILRIDVDGGDPYAVPPGNPFTTTDGLGEIWAYGLRNPWRFSIDAAGGRLYVGDVGEENWEEIDTVALADGGANFGWPLMEGSTCYFDAACGSRTDVIRPILEYPHEGDQCAVTGGYVYRGAAIPQLDGHYFYADWCAGWVRSFVFDGENVTQPQDWTAALGELGSVASFGLDGAGELLLVASDTGAVYRLEAAS
ncbi:MAG: PQQ-dependent sugar dehydrogenase [Actinobacteria bacterium]|nr:PQQ-dependent sugar dehydrogenase [Actinomycetota bacterium]